MTWIGHLYDTYEYVSRHGVAEGDPPLLPMCHTTQNAHIEIILDPEGKFMYASAVPRDERLTAIPSTEESAGRSGTKPVPHPLCDGLQYVAGDFGDHGGKVTSGFSDGEPHRLYVDQLRRWVTSVHAHPKAAAILQYIERGRVVSDLVTSGVLHVDASGRLLERWNGDRSDRPLVFEARNAGDSQHKSLVRWRIEVPGDPHSATWDDESVIESWIAYYRSTQEKRGFDMVTGSDNVVLTKQHPKRLRDGGDGAKLISTNRENWLTFRGRFFDADQAASVSFDISQKAHNALRWLIEKGQRYRDGDQVVVIWSPRGKRLPEAVANSEELLNEEEEGPADTAELFAQRLSRKMAGYRAELGATDHVVMIGLDSATTGRMAITLYREITGADLVDRIERWHQQFAWFQDYGRSDGRYHQFVGAPAPREIAEAAYGSKANEKLRRATVERILPSIIDGTPIPGDLVQSAVRRVSNPAGFQHGARSSDWVKCLGIACSLVRGANPERNYQMTLERDRTDRGYLYGRLLAIADDIERCALLMADETRGTSAERLMQAFADRPFAIWRTIGLALSPYKSRLRSRDQTRWFLVLRERELDEIYHLFEAREYEREGRLGGEFLLAFHAQRRELQRSGGRPQEMSGDASDDQ
jgi:CRISPR-associated protein Csd1